jgi:hypothetical protein
MQEIADLATDAEVESFRIGFKEFFVTSASMYEMNKLDTKVEWKAFIVFLSIMLLGLHNEKAEETIDMIPYMKSCFESEYFSSTTRALGAMYFGFARNKVSCSSVSLQCVYYTHTQDLRRSCTL